MKKIMFNDKYDLTQAVLDGRKTQTRRIANIAFYSLKNKEDVVVEDVFLENGAWYVRFKDVTHLMPKDYLPKYKIGEAVAIAQSYKDIFSEFSQCHNPQLNIGVKNPVDTTGWTNKMFVKTELMPHQIRITNIRVERLQDISDEDCLAEGIEFDSKAQQFYCGFKTSTNTRIWLGNTPRKAYSESIDKVSGKGTWDKNPFVWVYEFELVK